MVALSWERVFEKVDALGGSLCENSQTNLQNGQQLQRDANILADSVLEMNKTFSVQSNYFDEGVNLVLSPIHGEWVNKNNWIKIN